MNIDAAQNSYVLNSCEGTDLPQRDRFCQHLVSIFNDTNETIKVDFLFTYEDSDYEIAANIGRQGQITRASRGFEIKSKNWDHISIDDDNEFHRSRNVRISTLFQFTVNDKLVYDAYKYSGKGSSQRIQSYEFDDSKQMFYFPCSLKISET